ncbi:MAG: M20/M25/M40 family metallo-hydrolase [Liquorilactobacillus nagelii]|uniref:M20/M25/M40 family metallo-hydrolase n=1 Tax=Liquorilactobacillus nagelii TaxID=82688 RepID=UPI0039EC4FA5
MDDAEQILQDVIQIRTDGDYEARVADYLLKLLDIHHITTKKIEFSKNRSGFIAEIGNDQGPVLGFAGHEDTVALSNPADWTKDPLGGQKVDQRIYGRGATDMKAGLVAAVLAMINLKEQHIPLKGKFRIYGTVGEESGEEGAEKMVAAGMADDLEALMVGEPSGISLKVLQKLSSSLEKLGIVTASDVTELLNYNQSSEQHFLEIAHKGALSYDIISHGQTAHSSMPSLGINAVDGLLRFIYEQNIYFEELVKSNNSLLGTTTPVITKISGGEQLNTIPGEARLSILIRTIPEISNQQIIDQLHKILSKVNAKVKSQLTMKINFIHEPVFSSSQSKLSKIAQTEGEPLLQQKLGFIGVPGGTDASQFVKANPQLDVLVFGPGNTSAHQVDEYVDTEIFHSFIKVYEQIVARYLA